MRLFQKIFFPLVIACLLLVPVFHIGTTELQHGNAVAPPKNEACYKAPAAQLNREAEQPVPARYAGNAGYNAGHSAAGKVLPLFFLPAAQYLSLHGAATHIHAYTGVAHSFVPLLRLLLYPKHWFW